MTTRSRAALAWMLAALLPGAACRSSTPTGPSPTGPRSGTWSGTVADPVNGTGALHVVLEDHRIDSERSLLTGTWTTTFGNAARNSGGSVTGTVTTSAGSLSLTPTRPPACPAPTPFPAAIGSYAVPSLAVGTDALRGAYVFTTCDGTVPGTLELRR